mmetsp:Transcript_3612/g.7387  ORF Transcript_3612/g.7387 Transcript_3612/m.7387 type:complete len:108 (-) Transcript_3612:409-732(-)
METIKKSDGGPGFEPNFLVTIFYCIQLQQKNTWVLGNVCIDQSSIQLQATSRLRTFFETMSLTNHAITCRHPQAKRIRTGMDAEQDRHGCMETGGTHQKSQNSKGCA